MGLFSKKIETLTDEQIMTDALSRGGSEEEIRAVLGLPPKEGAAEYAALAAASTS